MTFLNFSKCKIIDDKKYDYIIIGAGIAGIILSYLLENYNILLIEKGSLNFDNKLNKINDFETSSEFSRDNKIKRIFQIGGSGNIWAGRMMFYDNHDLRDWPIKYEDLISYYNKALKLLNINTTYHDINNKKSIYKDKIFDSVFHDDKLNIVSSFWSKKIERFNSKSYFFKKIKNRKNLDILYNASVTELFCENDDTVVTHIEIKEKSKKQYLYGRNFILSMGSIENSRLLLHSQLRNKRNFNINNNVGKFFMDHPTYVSQPITLNKSIKESNFFINIFESGLIQKGISFNNNYLNQKNLLNNYLQINYKFNNNIENTYQSFYEFYKKIKTNHFKKLSYKDFNLLKNPKLLPDIIYKLTPKELIPFKILYIYEKFNKIFNLKIPIHKIVLVHHMEQIPNINNKIILSKNVDYNNIPIARVINEIDSETVNSANLLQNLVITNLKKNFIINKDIHLPQINKKLLSDSSHHIGGTRMGNNINNSVVNKNLLHHDKKNLFIMGSSVFPTSGHANPTLTIIALTIRLSEYLNKYNKL